MRGIFVWFGNVALARFAVSFYCVLPNGLWGMETLRGRDFDGAAERRGSVVCADSHARSLELERMSLAQYSQFELDVFRISGRQPTSFWMTGYAVLCEALRNGGPHRMIAVDDLHVCEMCPSATSPRIRMVQRRFVGAAFDPLSVMMDESVAAIVGETASVLTAVSVAREGAIGTVMSGVLAETPPANAAEWGAALDPTPACLLSVGAGGAKLTSWNLGTGLDELFDGKTSAEEFEAFVGRETEAQEALGRLEAFEASLANFDRHAGSELAVSPASLPAAEEEAEDDPEDELPELLCGSDSDSESDSELDNTCKSPPSVVLPSPSSKT